MMLLILVTRGEATHPRIELDDPSKKPWLFDIAFGITRQEKEGTLLL
jgi:hypothetical protein